jgi:hypothetical protein
MPKDFQIELEGTEQLKAFFQDMPRQFGLQVLGDIAQKGAAVIRSEARRQMPVDGELGRIGKKAVIIGKNKANRTERVVTIGSAYLSYKGKQVSLGKIIRHMTAGRQNLRRTRRGFQRGKVEFRLGDFIQKAFARRKDLAIKTMGEATFKIIAKRASRAAGIRYGS